LIARCTDVGAEIFGPAPTQRYRTGQILNSRIIQTKTAEVTEVIIIRYTTNIGIQIKIGGQALAILTHEQPALVTQLLVIRQVVACQLSGKAVTQITELPPQHGATLAHEARRQGGVVIRSQVQVVRHAEIKTTASRHAVSRQEETGLALFAQRKGQVGRVQKGHALEVQNAITRHPFVFLGVQVYL